VTRFTADSRDRVFDAVDMLALVSTRVPELRRAGVDSYFGLCPFHDERTPSFHVRPDSKHYHCFGCQVSGDPFTWVMETEGVDFKGALQSLADRFGIQLVTEGEDPEAAARRERRARLHALLDRTATYYSRYLWDAREAVDARAYLLGRGLEERTLREFRVGYAPSAWDKVLVASRQAGYSEDELLAAGLAVKSRSTPGAIYDFFRERIMFPAVDARGRVRGFGARRMRENQHGGKYINTADNDLYHKREVLFGIDLARAAAAKAGRIVLVEGYTDVLALHQAGITNSVGIMGTSLTEEQVGELKRIVKVLELCLDADRAGQEAMVRAARVAAGHNLELRVVPLPEGADPAELVERDGAESLRELVAASQPFVAFNVARILAAADTRSPEGRDVALAQLRPMFDGLGASLLRDDLVRRVAGRLELKESQVATLLARAAGAPPAGGAGRNGNGAAPAPRDPAERAQRLFLALCVALPEQGAAALAGLELDEVFTSAALRRAAHHLRDHTRNPLADLPSEDEHFARTVGDLVELSGRVRDPTADRLEHARLLLELERLERAIIRARAEGAGTSELARRREDVRIALRAVNARLEKTI
jgi:DNA primase